MTIPSRTGAFRAAVFDFVQRIAGASMEVGRTLVSHGVRAPEVDYSGTLPDVRELVAGS